MCSYLRHLAKAFAIGIDSAFQDPLLPPLAINMPSTTATGDFGPAPPGVDLSQNQNGKLLGAVVPVAVCGTVAVGLRFFARRKGKDVKLAVDDYLLMAALVRHALLSSLQTVTNCYGIQCFSWGTAISCFISANSRNCIP